MPSAIKQLSQFLLHPHGNVSFIILLPLLGGFGGVEPPVFG
jgi:hypothetical protein